MSAATAPADAPPRPPATPKQAPPAAPPPPPEGNPVPRAPTPPDWQFRCLMILIVLWGVLFAFHIS